MSQRARPLALAAIVLVLAGCSSTPQHPASGSARAVPSRGGGYYLDDGPGDNPPADLASIPDAVPRTEPYKDSANRPYAALGKDYVPLKTATGFSERGLASWYGRRYNGKPTSTGEIYDMYAMTAAHTTLPLPCYVRVTNLKNGKSVVVRVNDRGPFHDGRIIDLSYTAAWKLDILKGVTEVQVDGIDPAGPLPPPANLAQTKPATPALSATVALAPPASAPSAPATYLQLGAFSSNAGAEQIARQLQARFGDSLPAVNTQHAGNLFKVYMGPFASVAEADLAAQRVEQETGIHSVKNSH